MRGNPKEAFGFMDQLWSTQPYDVFKPTRSALTRGLFTYQTVLRFDPQLFQGSSVLDFGCGATNLRSLLEREGVKPKAVHMVDVDPSIKQINPKALILDGRGLRSRFRPASIDYTLASASTFQINHQDRPGVFDQLLQVTSKAVHIAPIYRPDFETLEELSKRRGFEVVVCRPYDATYPKFRPDSAEHYQDIIDSYQLGERVIPPEADGPVYKYRLFLYYNLDLVQGSSYIILRRNNLKPKL